MTDPVWGSQGISHTIPGFALSFLAGYAARVPDSRPQ